MNSTIIEHLQNLLNEAKGGKSTNDPFRVKAYVKAIQTIKAFPGEIRTGKDAIAIGVGKKIAERIDELVKGGITSKAEDTSSKILQEFTKIWGVGPVKAKALYGSGARTIEDIRKNPALLNDKQKVGLKYFDDLQKRVPREHVEEIVARIAKEIPKLKFQTCGSYRRKQPTCGDMDLLVCGGSLAAIVEKLKSANILFETLAIGTTKYMGITKTSASVAFRIDIEVVSLEEWPFALLYFTGSGPFNEHQRKIAKKMGYSLSERGLKNVESGEFVSGLKSEEDIFHFLNMEYLQPENRNKI